MTSDGGLSRFQKRMKAVPKAVRENVKPALNKSGQELVATMRTLAEASRDSGDLIDSILMTEGGQKTPPYSQPGGSTIVPEHAVAVTVGNSDVRYPHLVEYGSKNAPAQPFFWPAVRTTKKRITGRIKRSISKAVKDEWGSR
ncbi:HK97-gp10 family putative phage morphogenesis protein [Ahrensia sp. 13_GOM-1096m]|uniref:HK97-gp10 family putative phage morphogenesis protein n=1 Tax=Ahrensia sp. 13_GOM-1096m TaxID=1380380 RepID=UPI00047A348D|nr:HK97-gp10 family putative phage morphogenesis protein [Ahrensia sp. 13_GOM-1096m]